MLLKDYFFCIFSLLIVVMTTVAFVRNADASEISKDIEVNSIYWSDADSGRINGTIKFRLNGVDAPETGGVGAAIGPAKCENERKLGLDAKEWMIEFTKGQRILIAKVYGNKTHGRIVVDLSVNDKDLANIGLIEGVFKPWPHSGSRALSPKPNWCS